MSNEPVNLSGHLGPNVPKETEKQIAEVVTRVLAHPDIDVMAVLRRARSIAQNAKLGKINNLMHYATKALFGLAQRSRELQVAESRRRESNVDLEQIADPRSGSPEEQLEASRLWERIKAELSDMQFAVLTKWSYGFSHKEISQQLNISEANSRYYLTSARRAVRAKLGKK